MSDLNITLPSVRRLHSLIKENQAIELKLLTGDEIKGQVKWLDEHCLCIHTADASIVVWQHAIAYIKTKA
jgi:host factor-I protein